MDVNEVISLLSELADARDRSGRPVDRSALISREEYVDAVRLASKLLGGLKTDGDVPKERAKSGAAWSDQEEAFLAQGFDEGKSIPELASMLNRSASSVNSRLQKLGKNMSEY